MQAQNILAIFKDVTDDRMAKKMQERVMTLVGGVQIYIPMETRAFRNEIALEVYDTYDGKMKTLQTICREKDISFTQVYRLWDEGRNIRSKQYQGGKHGN